MRQAINDKDDNTTTEEETWAYGKSGTRDPKD